MTRILSLRLLTKCQNKTKRGDASEVHKSTTFHDEARAQAKRFPGLKIAWVKKKLKAINLSLKTLGCLSMTKRSQVSMRYQYCLVRATTTIYFKLKKPLTLSSNGLWRRDAKINLLQSTLVWFGVLLLINFKRKVISIRSGKVTSSKSLKPTLKLILMQVSGINLQDQNVSTLI